MSTNYWGYRIDTRYIDFFESELQNGRLRQGWGYLEGQNLKNMTEDRGARKNLCMLEVKKGDILIIPRIPDWNFVTIAKATKDWDEGYNFEISEHGDFGHIFPAEKLCCFVRESNVVSANVRKSLKTRNRFWNMEHLSDEINLIRTSNDSDKMKSIDRLDKANEIMMKSFYSHFDEQKFKDDIYKEMCENFTASEWEDLIVMGLDVLYPYYTVTKVGGKQEHKHGTDILITMPQPIDEAKPYAIAIQIKDYVGEVNKVTIEKILNQVSFAEDYWTAKEYIVIDKIVLMTRAKSISVEMEENKNNVKFYCGTETKELLGKIASAHIGFDVDQ